MTKRIVYAFEWCSCVHESGFSIESLHASKVGAWKAMRKTLWERWVKDAEPSPYGKRRRFLPLNNEAWRVRAIDVME